MQREVTLEKARRHLSTEQVRSCAGTNARKFDQSDEDSSSFEWKGCALVMLALPWSCQFSLLFSFGITKMLI